MCVATSGTDGSPRQGDQPCHPGIVLRGVALKLGVQAVAEELFQRAEQARSHGSLPIHQQAGKRTPATSAQADQPG